MRAIVAVFLCPGLLSCTLLFDPAGDVVDGAPVDAADGAPVDAEVLPSNGIPQDALHAGEAVDTADTPFVVIDTDGETITAGEGGDQLDGFAESTVSQEGGPEIVVFSFASLKIDA